MPRESSILNRTRSHLLSLAIDGAHFIKTTAGGEPDLVGSIDGRAYVCETKQPGKKPEPLQYVRLKQWAQAGAVALWTDGKSYYRISEHGNEAEIAGFDKTALFHALIARMDVRQRPVEVVKCRGCHDGDGTFALRTGSYEIRLEDDSAAQQWHCRVCGRQF